MQTDRLCSEGLADHAFIAVGPRRRFVGVAPKLLKTAASSLWWGVAEVHADKIR